MGCRFYGYGNNCFMISKGINYASRIAVCVDIAQSTVTEKLLELEKLGLVRKRRDGKAVVYSVNKVKLRPLVRGSIQRLDDEIYTAKLLMSMIL
jgi:DNA-binding transcriptional ArsR family regulator